MRTRTIHVLLIAVVALGAAAGVAAADGGLSVTVDDLDDEPTVTVTENDTAVANAEVTVETVEENASYAGENETYVTAENGTVVLPAADEDVTVEITAEYENETATTTVDLTAPIDLDVAVDGADDDPIVTVTDGNETVENASVTVETVDENATYAGVGNYSTDANGTVDLPVPETNVTVDVTAASEGATASTTAELIAAADEEPASFGQLVREFIASFDDRAGGIGAAVSDHVTENNPGNAPDHAGNGSGAGQGPPDHAGNGSDDATDAEETDDGSDAGTEASDAPDGSGGSGNGSDAHDGTGAGNGNGADDGNGPGNGAGNGNGPPGN